MVWIGIFLGSTVGGFVPELWGGGIMSEIVFSGIGAFAGIYFGFKLSQW
jgi:hypothetical protein